MVIDRQKFEAATGKKPGGFSREWRFALHLEGGRTENVKFEGVDFYRATQLLKGYASTRALRVVRAEVEA